MPITSNTPFGFFKDPNDKNKWIADEEAVTIRQIYELYVYKEISYTDIEGYLIDHKIDGVSYRSDT